MRIEMISAPELQGQTLPAAADGAALDLEVGEKLDVTVLRSENGAVLLKTEDGKLVRARLEGEAALPAGGTATLTVSEKRDGTIYLSAGDRGELTAQPAAAAKPPASGPPDPGRPAGLAAELSRLRLPANEETVRLMEHILKENPALPLPRAAFLAANRIAPTPALLGAAEALLTGGETVSTLLEALSQAIEAGAKAVQTPAAAEDAAPQASLPESAPEGAPFSPGLPAGGTGERVLREGGADPSSGRIPTDAARGETAAARPAAPEGGTLRAETPGTERTMKIPAAPPEGGRAQEPRGGKEPPALGAQDAAPKAQSAMTPAGARKPPGAAGQDAPASKDIFALATEMERDPDAFHTTREGARRLSQILEGATTELAAAREEGPKAAARLTDFLDRLYAKPEGAAPGEKLSRARQELYPKLAVLEQALGGAASGRAAAPEGVRKILDQGTLMSRVDQFYCMQIPVTLQGEHKAVDFFVYKQKAKEKKIDPENVKILLGLDLAHMGRLESLIEIRGKEVSLRFSTEKETAADLLKRAGVKLYSALGAVGYKLVDTRTAPLRERTTPQNALQALGTYEEEKRGGWDVTV